MKTKIRIIEGESSVKKGPAGEYEKSKEKNVNKLEQTKEDILLKPKTISS